MSIDIYAACPCGSGKKFKFCCYALNDDMDRIIRLIEGNQPRVAIQQLETLSKKHPKNAWVGTTWAMLLLETNEGTTARDVLKLVLEEHPDNETAIVLYAAAMIRAEGFDAAKRAIHRAFQRSAKKLPALVSDLASSVAAAHASRNHMMAAREHLALALRLAPEERRQQLFIQLLELDGADDVAYPLRGSHQLPAVTGTDEQQKEVRKAQKYAAVGCWSTAADIFTTLADANPDRAELWHSAGLCRAWDGDEKSAAEALHRAARHYPDLPIAVECETIAQILDQENSSDVVEQHTYIAKVSSVSRLLTNLDEQPRFQRIQGPNAGREGAPVADYLILDTAKSDLNLSPERIDQVAHVVGQVAVFDVDKQSTEPHLMISGFRGAAFDDAKTLLTSAAGDLISWLTDAPQPQVTGSVSAETYYMETQWYLPPQTAIVRRRELFGQFWEQALNDKWPNHPLRALEGKTPLQAAGDPSLKVALLGAVYSLDAWIQQHDKIMGLKKVCDRLGIEPLHPLDVTPEAAVGSLSIMQLNRLPVEKLTDQQLITVVNRSMLIQREESLYHVLKEAVSRPSCAAQFDLDRILRTLSEICASEGRRDEAFMWLDHGRKLPVPEGKSAFQYVWTWDMAELGTRLEDPSDLQLKTLLNRFTTYYGPKVPQIRPYIEQTLREFGVPSPWESIEILTADQISSSQTLWTKETEEPVPAGGSKLWLPGQ